MHIVSMKPQLDHTKLEYEIDYNMDIVVTHGSESVPTICMGNVYPDYKIL